MSAVDECLRRYSGAVWGLARRFCPTPQDAEDAVQDIFVEIWRSAERFDADMGSEMTFIITIARRRLIDRNRKVGRRPRAQQLEEPAILPAEARADQAELADDVERAKAAMDQLRPEQKQVLQMALVEGQTHQEIAQSIGIPLGTVKSHARRGLMRVRSLLGLDPEPSKRGGS